MSTNGRTHPMRRKLAREMKRQGLTPTALARQIGESRQFVYYTLNSHFEPKLHRLRPMCRALGLAITDIM